MTPPTFSETIEPSHRHVDVDDWDGVYVVGDVHGCHERLLALLAELGVDADDLLVFVGDLVRKGPDSKHVLDFVRTHSNAISVRGNNEQKLLRGEETLPELTDDDLAYIEDLPLAISFEDTLVVHGGIDPRKPFDEQTQEDLLTMRSLSPEGSSYDGPFWYETYEGPPRVFFGHTVLEEPIVGAHAVGLDTGCVYGGRLTAYDVRRDRLVSVDGSHPGVERPDRKFLGPPVGMEANRP